MRYFCKMQDFKAFDNAMVRHKSRKWDWISSYPNSGAPI